MAGPLQMFAFMVRAEKTGETCGFLGQGTTIEEAWKDGCACINAPFRPSSSGGRPNKPLDLSVTLKDGTKVNRPKEAFESGIPWQKNP